MKVFFDKHLFVARHGQTVWNLQEKYQGIHDSPLSPEGLSQAHILGEQVKELGIEVFISSPLKRALDTALIVKEYINVPEIIMMREFRERNYGVYEGKTRDEVHILYPEIAAKNLTHSWTTQPPEAEPLVDFEKRIISALKEIKNLYFPKKVLIISHAGVLRMIVKYFNNISRDEMFNYLPHNCQLLNF